LNFSVIQNESIYFPSPCGRLSRPRTTTEVLPPSRLIGMDSLRFWLCQSYYLCYYRFAFWHFYPTRLPWFPW